MASYAPMERGVLRPDRPVPMASTRRRWTSGPVQGVPAVSCPPAAKDRVGVAPTST